MAESRPTDHEKALQAEVERLADEVRRLQGLLGQRTPGADAPRPVDAKVFEELMEAVGRETIEEVLGSFREDTPKALRDMRAAVARGDAAALRSLAHPQVSVCHALGARGMSALAARVEDLAEKGDVSAAVPVLDELERLVAPVTAELQRLQGGGRPPAEPARAPAPESPRILVVEDNPTNLRLAMVLLESLGHRAEGASNGREALAALEKARYDVVLMDMMMPIMDGLKTTRAICARWPRGRRPRIIALTGLTSEAERQACFAAGVDDYIAKPVTAPVLATKIPRAGAAAAPAPATAHAEPEPRTVIHAGVAPTLDTTVLKNWANVRKEAAVQAADIFLKGLPGMLGDLRSAMRSLNAPAFARAAHSLKSASIAVGAMAMANLAAELEALGRAGSVRKVEADLARLEAMQGPLTKELETERRRYA